MSKPTSKTNRIPAIDFTKGALVLFMVLYHWLNYFYGPEGDVYKYLRFLTPSFIFITGFLISNVYIPKYDFRDSGLPKRLAQRGLKILGIFIALNAGMTLLLPRSSDGGPILPVLSASRLIPIYLNGNVNIPGAGKMDSFHILVPIGYLLIVSALLLIVSRFCKYIFHFASLFSLLGLLALELTGCQSINLELVAIGLLGASFGYIPADKVNNIVKHPYFLVLAYLCYLSAINIWNVGFPLQTVGVCLTVMLLYLLGAIGKERGPVRQFVVLVGKYSLFGYIAQIAILQLLHKGLQNINLSFAVLGFSFLAALVLTMMGVEVVDRARARANSVDWLYRVVFN